MLRIGMLGGMSWESSAEIELLVGAEDSSVPLLATTRLHVEAAVDRALAGVRP